MTSFTLSPGFGNATSYSHTWPSRYAPADDGSCGEIVAVSVLNAFDIPIMGSYPLRGRLCGVDINNMPAADAIQFSLAENMIDGKFIEVYTNEEGFAYFSEVYPSPEVVTLDIRTCVPTSNIDKTVDLVIVRGYDSPPVRTFKNFESLQWDPVDSMSNHVPKTYCHGHHFATEAWKSYKDPVLETSYKDGVENLYELDAFESLVGYVIHFNGSTDPNVKYSQSSSTTKLVEIDFPGLSCCQSTILCDETGSSNVQYASFSYHLGDFSGKDKFGEDWPLLMTVQGIYLYGRRIIRLTDSTALQTGYVGIYVEDKAKLVSLPGNNWYWELDAGGGATVNMHASTYEGDYFLDTLAGSQGRQKVIPISTSASVPPTSGLVTASVFPNINGALGMVVDGCIAAVEIDRPSFVVNDPNGNASYYANDLEVAYQPIIVIDEPAPVAYTFGESVNLIDHTLDMYDSDPSTQQVTPSLLTGSMAWLQTQTSGKTVDVSLPFADADQCRQLAQTIFNLQEENIDTYQLVCGPRSEPKLGAQVNGFSGRINRISYSYTDSSAYAINVTIGPTFVGARGWSTSIWQRRTEDVSREGIVVWSAGDGVNYRVKLQGLGVYAAINKTLSAFVPGEKVKCTVHNNPMEI